MSHAQDMERRNERHELQQELGHSEEENRALRASLEDERATVEQMDAKHGALQRAFEQQSEELQRAITASGDKRREIAVLREVMDAQQDEIAHLQAQLVASSARECVCGGESCS